MNEGIRFEKWLTAMCTEERLCNWPIWTSTSYTCICYLSVWSKRTNPLVRVHSVFEVSIQVGQLSQVQHGSLSKISLTKIKLSRKPSKITNLLFYGKEKINWIRLKMRGSPHSVSNRTLALVSGLIPALANWKVVNLCESSWMLTNHIRLRPDGDRRQWVHVVRLVQVPFPVATYEKDILREAKKNLKMRANFIINTFWLLQFLKLFLL